MPVSDAEYLYPERPMRASESASLAKIRLFSRPFEYAFAAIAGGLLVFSLLVIAMVFAPGGPYVFVGAEGGLFTFDPTTAPDGYVAVNTLPAAALVVALIAASVIQGTQVAGFFLLSRLFAGYRRGLVFAETAIETMRRAGVAFLAAGAAPGLMQPFVRAAGALDENWFHTESVAALLFGAALFVFAHIMTLGMEIERDNKGFV